MTARKRQILTIGPLIVRWICQWSVCSSQKGVVMQKAFPCHVKDLMFIHFDSTKWFWIRFHQFDRRANINSYRVTYSDTYGENSWKKTHIMPNLTLPLSSRHPQQIMELYVHVAEIICMPWALYSQNKLSCTAGLMPASSKLSYSVRYDFAHGDVSTALSCQGQHFKVTGLLEIRTLSNQISAELNYCGNIVSEPNRSIDYFTQIKHNLNIYMVGIINPFDYFHVLHKCSWLRDTENFLLY